MHSLHITCESESILGVVKCDDHRSQAVTLRSRDPMSPVHLWQDSVCCPGLEEGFLLFNPDFPLLFLHLLLFHLLLGLSVWLTSSVSCRSRCAGFRRRSAPVSRRNRRWRIRRSSRRSSRRQVPEAAGLSALGRPGSRMEDQVFM